MSSSGSPPARFAVAFGLLAVAVVPADVVAARALEQVRLLESLYVAAPISTFLGLLALLCARRARLRLARSVFQQSRGVVRAARVFAWAGTWVGATAGVALAVYAALRWLGTQ